MAFTKFADGNPLQAVGFGTCKSPPDVVEQAIKIALEICYRYFDLASSYENQKEIGVAFTEAFASGKYKREDLFMTSKMEKIKEARLAKHIGVSNFNVQLLNDLYAAAKIKPEDNQVELHPYNQQNGLIDFCQKKGIHVTVYSPLLKGGKVGEIDPFTDPVLIKIAAKHMKSIAQILVRWGFQRNSNISVLPKTVTPVRIKENFEVFDFELDADDFAEIAMLDRKQRVLDIPKMFGFDVFA
ncbi:MAG: putative Aldo-keto reductase family 1 member B10 [Streblomastix strix]|uniref:Putative Aldo-keto reductase family 1 member B10 n=1 Tax=Streblomastix strix TaxID=222440 RepID=A0A5J4X8P7_9EUKA|nr:MAG: putative Aldo-keto reductase family 1 member B10 [Streblomastix strix]